MLDYVFCIVSYKLLITQPSLHLQILSRQRREEKLGKKKKSPTNFFWRESEVVVEKEEVSKWQKAYTPKNQQQQHKQPQLVSFHGNEAVATFQHMIVFLRATTEQQRSIEGGHSH